MLHILLLILKIIGYMLLTILGIVLVLILLVLFTPLKYDIYGQVNNSIESLSGRVEFGYFFNILNGQFVYKDGRPRYYVAVFKKKIICSKKQREEAEERRNTTTSSESTNHDDTVTKNEIKQETVKSEVTEYKDFKVPFDGEITEDDFRYVESENKDENSTMKVKPDNEFNNSSKEEYSNQTSSDTKKPKKKCDIKKKLNSIIDKIKNIYNTICDKIKMIKENKAVIDKFFNDEIHKKAIRKVFKEIKVLLMKLKPYNLKGNIEYDFEDPALTGKVLAGYSMVSPFIGGKLEVTPYFNNELFYKGNIGFKGKIRPSYFVAAVIKLAVRKCMWTTFKDAKAIIDERKIGGI